MICCKLDKYNDQFVPKGLKMHACNCSHFSHKRSLEGIPQKLRHTIVLNLKVACIEVQTVSIRCSVVAHNITS